MDTQLFDKSLEVIPPMGATAKTVTGVTAIEIRQCLATISLYVQSNANIAGDCTILVTKDTLPYATFYLGEVTTPNNFDFAFWIKEKGDYNVTIDHSDVAGLIELNSAFFGKLNVITR